MRTGRRIGTVAATAAAAMSVVFVAFASQAAATPSATAGQSRTAGPNAAAGLHAGDREFTSFSRGDALGRGRTDYTSFRVEAQRGRNDFALLAATISYTDCTRGSRVLSYTTGLMLPLGS
jgi:hypothetical protein